MATATDDAPPPAYDEAIASSTARSSRGSPSSNTVQVVSPSPHIPQPARVQPQAPPAQEVQRAIAPLVVNKAAYGGIKTDYVVDPSHNSYEPDVVLKTITGAIKSQITLAKAVARRVRVEAESVNGSIAIFFPEVPAGQAAGLSAKSVTGRVAVALPRSYEGLIAIETVTGKVTLSGPLRANSSLAPNARPALYPLTTYRIRPQSPFEASDHSAGLGDAKRAPPELGTTAVGQTCDVVTVNGNVSLAYNDENAVVSGKLGKASAADCVIA